LSKFKLPRQPRQENFVRKIAADPRKIADDV
jgi:hypothetical protein